MPETNPNSALLKEIRENYTIFKQEWQPIVDEGDRDMLAVGGDPWEAKEREFRDKYDRPILTWDELSPYVNQLVNDLRQNKRAIKINPPSWSENRRKNFSSKNCTSIALQTRTACYRTPLSRKLTLPT